MRTTLNIDDEVMAAIKEMARQKNQTTGEVVSRYLREALRNPAGSSERSGDDNKLPGGFRPFSPRDAPVTNEAVNHIRDEEGL